MALAISAGHQTGVITGYISTADSSGDYYRLGNLSYGTTIHLNLEKPTTSDVSTVMQIYDSAGTAVATSSAGARHSAVNAATAAFE